MLDHYSNYRSKITRVGDLDPVTDMSLDMARCSYGKNGDTFASTVAKVKIKRCNWKACTRLKRQDCTGKEVRLLHCIYLYVPWLECQLVVAFAKSRLMVE
jgi:hypothetical protein